VGRAESGLVSGCIQEAWCRYAPLEWRLPMVALKRVLSLFSRRHRARDLPSRPLASQFRTRVLLLLRERLGRDPAEAGRQPVLEELLEDAHRRLCMLFGRPHLTDGGRGPVDDLAAFLLSCDDAHFLDFIECVFSSDCIWKIWDAADKLASEIDELFRADDLPYALTSYTRETQEAEFHGRMRPSIVTTAYPTVVCRDSDAAFTTITAPALELLRDQRFTSANHEYLAALEEYRKGRYGECLTKCGSAFESAMRAICHAKKWPHAEAATAAPLLHTIIERSGVESYFEQPLLLVATLRNRLGSAHGAGVGVRAPTAARTRYTLNATAAGILFLVEECME